MSLRQAIERYGIAIGVIVAMVVVLIALPGNTKGQTGASQTGLAAGPASAGATATPGATDTGVDAGATAGATPAAGAATGAPAAGATGAKPATGAAAPQAGAQPAAGGPSYKLAATGPNCRADGRQLGVPYSMPPCATWTSAPNNGGATTRGVTANKITIVRYLTQVDPGTRAILQNAGLSDDPSVVKRAYDAITRYDNLHFETYGRQVVMEDVAASGPPTSDEASRADAIHIANDIKPFAVIEGDPAGAAPVTFIKELARRNVPCLCSTSLPSDVYTSLPPIVFSPLPTVNEYAQEAAEYACKHLGNGPASFAGVGVQNQPRKYGLIYLAGQNGVVFPELAETKQIAEQAFASCGIQFAKEIQYIYDPGRNQQDVTNLIAQLKAAGVTTVVPFWDPLYPILITGEATRQAYFPEWMITGTGLSDTTTAGRLYDQQQWQHAFGISPLWVTWATVAKSGGYRQYHWARPQDPPGSEGVLINIYNSRINELFTILQMAGPVLTNDTFSAGAFAYPKTGGSAARPLLFRTKQFPTAIKDFVEVWYSPNTSGPDERGQNGNGMVMKADGGKRYQAGQWYTGPAKAFQQAGAVTVSDNPDGGGDSPTDSDPNAVPATKACLSCS